MLAFATRHDVLGHCRSGPGAGHPPAGAGLGAAGARLPVRRAAGRGQGHRGRALGLALICPLKPGEGCGKCEQCHRVLSRNHPDAWLFDAAGLQDAAKASGDKSAVKYAARQVFPYALAAPHEAATRLLVIDHADELSPDVQNTLLKTLEEPRPAVHIVLVEYHASIREALASTFEGEGFEVVGQAGSMAQARGMLEERQHPIDVAVLDLACPMATGQT